jgi:hypothetical protein
MQEIQIKVLADGTATINKSTVDWIPGLVAGASLSTKEAAQTLAELKSPLKDTQFSLIEPSGEKHLLLKGGVDIHPHLDWNQVLFIQNKVITLETIGKAKKFYTGKSHVCIYAKNFARAHYGSNDRQEAYVPVEEWEKKTSSKANDLLEEHGILAPI